MGIFLTLFIMVTFFGYLFQCIRYFLSAANIVLSFIYNENLNIWGTPIYLILYIIFICSILLNHFGFDEVDNND